MLTKFDGAKSRLKIVLVRLKLALKKSLLNGAKSGKQRRLIYLRAMKMQNEIYVVLIEDRHVDNKVEAWSSIDAAIERAGEIALAYAKEQSDIEIYDIDGYEYVAVYSSEGDCVSVEKVTINQPFDK